MKRLTIILMLILMVTGCSQIGTQQTDMTSYEKLTSKHHYIEKDYDKIVNDLLAKKNGIYFIGFPENEASQDLVVVLDNVLEETHETAYYINTRNKEFTTEVYKKYLEFEESLDDYLRSHENMPFIIVINEAGIYTTTPRIDGEELGSGHLSNVAQDIIQEQLKAVISNEN